jgi:hypothetical protein
MKTNTVSQVEIPSDHLALMLGKLRLMGLSHRQSLILAEIFDLITEKAPNDRGSLYNHEFMKMELLQVPDDRTSTIITSAKSRKR